MTSPRIIICATQRSGSTLVCEDLRNSDLGLAEEHFLRVIGPNRPKDRPVDLNIVEKAARGPNGILSIKVMSSYADQVNQVLSAHGLGSDGPGKPWPALHDYFRDAIWIHIERRSTLRQAISRVVSRHTGINHAVASTDAPFVPGRSQFGHVPDYSENVPFRPDEIEQQLINIAVETFRWEEFFAEHHLSPMRIVYEDIVDNADYLSRIRREASLSEIASPPPRNLLKLANDKTERIIDEFLTNWSPERDRAGRPAAARPAASPAPAPPSDLLAGLRKSVAASASRWVNSPYYAAVESHARPQWDNLIAPFLEGQDIDYSSVLDLGIGHGRMTQILLEKAKRVVGVDVVQENINFCRQRFLRTANITLLRNDGVTLRGIEDGSISFIFCFDTMVNFDSDLIRSYLAEFRRVLKPGGTAFCHHSNLGRNPDGDPQRAPHARSFMTEALFRHYAHKATLSVVKKQVIDWGAGERLVSQLDCLSLLRRDTEEPARSAAA